MQPVNGRRIPNTPRLRREYSTPRLHQNAEIISYVCDSWNQVSRDYRSKSTFVTGGISGVPNVTYYQPTGSNNRLAKIHSETLAILYLYRTSVLEIKFKDLL